MNIPSPFLLYLGHTTDPVGIKTSRGLAEFRRADCLGEFRHDDCPLTLGLPRMTIPEGAAAGARTLVLGIANAGGIMDAALIADASAALEAGLNVASGLHHRLNAVPELVALANSKGLALFDVRDPPADLPVGTGRPRAGRRVLTVGTDCSVGKMYASLALVDGLRSRGETADFRATGQTGILIAGGGVPLDAVVADFISGAIEYLTPARTDDGCWSYARMPKWIAVGEYHTSTTVESSAGRESTGWYWKKRSARAASCHSCARARPACSTAWAVPKGLSW